MTEQHIDPDEVTADDPVPPWVPHVEARAGVASASGEVSA
jgi:hypothetical protein